VVLVAGETGCGKTTQVALIGSKRDAITNSHIPQGPRLSGDAHPQLGASPPTDNCPQPKEAQPLSQLDIRLI
jgi:hypothetical protein